MYAEGMGCGRRWVSWVLQGTVTASWRQGVPWRISLTMGWMSQPAVYPSMGQRGCWKRIGDGWSSISVSGTYRLGRVTLCGVGWGNLVSKGIQVICWELITTWLEKSENVYFERLANFGDSKLYLLHCAKYKLSFHGWRFNIIQTLHAITSFWRSPLWSCYSPDHLPLYSTTSILLIFCSFCALAS